MSEDVLEIRARIECRDWMIREAAKGLLHRPAIARMVDEATGYQDEQLETMAVLLDDNASDLELLGHDGTECRKRAEETRKMKDNGKG